MKKFVLSLLIGCLLTSITSIFAATLKVTENPYPIYVNGTKQKINGYNINGNTCLYLFDAVAILNASFKYDKDSKSIMINTDANNKEGITNQKIDSLSIYQKDGKQYVDFDAGLTYLNQLKGTNIFTFTSIISDKDIIPNNQYDICLFQLYIFSPVVLQAQR
jgi:hypothetical protein